MTAQLKAISIDLRAIASLRNEVHELRVNIETLTERVDALLKATGEDTKGLSERSEPTTVPKGRSDTEVPEPETA